MRRSKGEIDKAMSEKIEQPHIIPEEEKLDGMNNIFCYAALTDKQNGTLYTDATGSLLTVSLEGNQYYFVAYDYDTNAIFAIPMKDVKDDTIIAAFDEIFKDLTKKDTNRHSM